MSSVFVRFSITKDEYAEGMRHLTAKQPATWVGPSIGVIVGLSGVLLGRGVLVGVGITLIALFVVSFRSAPAARWRTAPALAAEQTHVFTDDGVDVRVGAASERFPWGFYAQVAETRALYVLMRDRKQGNFVPKRAFRSPGEEAEFRVLVEEKVGPIGR